MSENAGKFCMKRKNWDFLEGKICHAKNILIFLYGSRENGYTKFVYTLKSNKIVFYIKPKFNCKIQTKKYAKMNQICYTK
jgi:hypothetical protein